MRHLTLSVVGWVLLTAATQAQGNWQIVTGLQPENRVRVRATDGRGATGNLHRVDAAHIEVLSRFKDVARFRREDVQQVEKLVGDPDVKKRGIRKGLIWGAVLSALGTIGPVMAGAPEGLPYVYGTFLSGGAAIGALTAEDNSSWVTIYSN